MVLILVFVAISIFFVFLVLNINLTVKTNHLKIPRLKRTWTLIILVGILSAIADEGVSILVKGNFIEAYKMSASSMENTLLVGDYLMATKDVDPENIQNGDIIVFKYPGDPRRNYSGKGTNWIKRVIAIERQTVKIVNKQVFVDGEPFDEPSTVKIDLYRILPHYSDRYQWGPGNRDNMPEIVVPEGKLFVMGDNRDNSSDSRFWGFVDIKDVIGKPRFIHFSWDSEKSRVRLERIGLRLDN
ncbi:MAG: signal peptidase I [Candidatus Zixiibacteriota bacterium]|nr:MAG: signal peptidase I [candidate division Zixibacteria bacterium]